MATPSCLRAVVGRLGRVAARGVGMRLSIAGVRIRISARGRSWSPHSEANHGDIEICVIGWGVGHCMQAVIGRMGRIAAHGVGMRITIAGMRIRISARRQSWIQDIMGPELG